VVAGIEGYPAGGRDGLGTSGRPAALLRGGLRRPPAQAGGVGRPAAIPRPSQAGQPEAFSKLIRVSGLIAEEWTGFRLDALPVPPGACRCGWPRGGNSSRGNKTTDRTPGRKRWCAISCRTLSSTFALFGAFDESY